MSAEMATLDEQLTQDESDARLNVRFDSRSMHSEVRSREEGRAVYEMVDFVTIMVPGDKDSIIERPAHEGDRQRFPKQWARYQASNTQVVGAPLVQMGTLTPAQIDELKYFGVQTVEQLAALADSNAQKFMGIQKLKQEATRYLDSIKSDAPVSKLRAELSSKDDELKTLKQQVVDLQKAVESLTAKKG